MKRITLSTAIIAALMLMPALSHAKTVTADGMGSTKALALSQAQISAIQKAVGVYISSETVVKNFQVAKDIIYAKSQGFVKTYKIVSETANPDKSITVTIEAEVDSIMNNLLKNEAALDLLLQWVSRPKFMVVLDEVDALNGKDIVAETEIIKQLRQKKFQVVDREQIKSVVKRDSAVAALAGDPAAAAAIATQFGAQIIVMGKCDAKALRHPALGNSVSGQANISARFVNADNAEIIATDSYHGKFVHVDPLTAGKTAAVSAADGLVDYLIAETVKEWGNMKANGATIQISISGMEYPMKSKVAGCLQHSVEGITEVISRSFTAGVGEYQVKFSGTADDLGGLLYGKDCGGFKLMVYEQTGNTIKCKVEKSQ